MTRRTILAGAGVAAALVIIAVALTNPYCRTPEGDLNGKFVCGLAAALAVLIAAGTARTPWTSSGRWFALALIGQAAALQLIDAGILIHYQHYRLPGQAIPDPVVGTALGIVVFQLVAVVVALACRRRAIQDCARGRHVIYLLTILAVCVPFSAAVSRDPQFYVWEACFAGFIQVLNAANVVMIAWALPAGGLKRLALKLDTWLCGRSQQNRTTIDRFAVFAALWVTIVSAFLVWLVYQHHPHVADEVAYLYNARYFAAGQVTMAAPPVEAAFVVDLMENQPGKWYSAVPLGWPAILAIGAMVKGAWLVNPILAGVNILLTYVFLGELYPRRTARIVVLFLCFSPWHIFVSMSYMTHTTTMTCALLAFLGVVRARRSGSFRWALLAGIGVGAGSLIRPLDGLIVGVLTAAWAIGGRLKFGALVVLGAATAITGALALPYNRMLTGDGISSPLMRYMDKHHGHNRNAYGFGPDRGLGWQTDAYPGHTPFEALINAELNGASLNTELLGWSTGSLVLIAVLLFSGSMRRPDYLMLAAIAAVILAYAPYWGNGGPDFGARYWYLMLLPCLVLCARGLEFLEAKLGLEERNDVRATAAVAALCCLVLVNYIPWRSLDKYHHYLRMRPDIQTLAKEHSFGRSLVLVRGENFPDYSSAAIYNPIDLRANAPVYAWDRDTATRDEVVSAYADRPVWIVEGPTITHTGYRLAAGPLKPRGFSASVSGSAGH